MLKTWKIFITVDTNLVASSLVFMDFEGRLGDEVSLEPILLLKDLMLVEEVEQGVLPALSIIDVDDIESSALIHFLCFCSSFP